MASPPIEKLRELLWRGQRGSLVAQMQQAEPPQAAEFLTTLPFEQQREIFSRLTPERAAQVVIALPYYHAYVLLHSVPSQSMRAIVDRIDPTAWTQFLDELPEETWRALMEELAPSLEPTKPSEAPAAETGTPRAPIAPVTAPAAPETQPAPEVPPETPEEQEPIIEAQRIEKSFEQPDGRKILVIAPLDLAVESGSITALLGPSGSGKSTLLRMLSGLSQPSEGVVLWHKEPIAECRPNAAIVFQSFALFPWLTVLENVEAPLVARGMGHSERHARALRALNTVGLEGFESAYPKELSGGMKQRVGLARALAVEPEVLFMDEPFSALDVLTAENLRREIVELWQNKKMPTRSIFLVTHNIEEAVQLADRILVLGRNPATVRADFRVPLAQPRDRKSAAFLLYVDYIYKIMTQPELSLAPPSANAAAAKPRPQSLPHTRPGSIAGLLELVVDRGGEEDLYHVAEELLLESDDLLPILDGAALLGFAKSGEGDVKITPEGRVFAEASIPVRKVLFRDAALAHVTLLQQMKSALEKKSDHQMPVEFFRDILDEHFSREESQRQVETAIGWGIYAEIFRYQRATDTIRLPKERGATAAARAQDELHE